MFDSISEINRIVNLFGIYFAARNKMNSIYLKLCLSGFQNSAAYKEI